MEGRSLARVSGVLFALLVVIGWSDARAQSCPTGGHDVTIASACTFNGGSHAFTGTLTISAGVTAASNVGNTAVALSSDHITITSAGSINATGRGFAAQNGPGHGGTAAGGSGAGHGGNGGYSNGGAAYGSITQPTMLGSGGGYTSGGAGGGAVRLTAAQTLTIHGTITANANGGGYISGGGAGGSILLEANTIAGTGSLQAFGGTSYLNNYGGGGGGRIALHAQSDTSTLFATALAYGAIGTTNAFGGAGTIYADIGGVTSLRVDNNGQVGGATPSRQSFAVDHLLVGSGALFRVDNGHVVDVGTSITGGGTSARIGVAVGGTFNPPSATTVLDRVGIELYGTWGRTTDLTVQSATVIHGGTFSGPLAHLSVGAGATFSRVGLAAFALESVTVLSGGTLTHQPNTNAETHKLDVAATTIDIRAGGVVSANTTGYTAQNGPSNGGTSGAGYGAGHGGLGGNGSAAAYGSVTQPTTLGSGGGYSSGGIGGGAIKLVASGTLTIDGTVTANASSGGYSSGGGAGGSIWLQAASLHGSGTLRANGGGSYLNNQGGGAGGRIAIYAGADTSSLFAATNIQAAGGLNNAGAGTIYGDIGGVTSLRIDNNGVVGGVTPSRGSMVVDHVSVRGGGLFRIDSGHQIEATSSVGGSGASARLWVQAGGTFVAPSATTLLSGLNVELYGTWARTTDLTVLAGAFVHGGVFSGPLAHLTIGAAGTFSRAGLTSFALDSVTVSSGGTLTHQPNSNAEAHKLDVSAMAIDIQAGGTVSVNGAGYTAQNGPAHGTTSGAGYGAGHGGLGGNGNAAAYGSVTEPVTLGSGGGYSSGGAGGGAVKLVASGALTVDGTITTNGLSGGYSSGGGAGGSIWLQAASLHGVGTLRANGGGSYLNNQGGGAGGRISLVAGVDASSLLGGTSLQAASGPLNGGAGTIYTDLGGVRSLRVDNNGAVGGATPSRGSLVVDHLAVRSGGLFRIDNGHTVDVVGSIGGSGASARLVVQSGATIVAPSASTVLSGLNVELYGTWGRTTDLTVQAGSFVHGGVFSGPLANLTVDAAGTFSRAGLTTFELGTVTVRSGGTLTHQPNGATESHKLDVAADRIEIQTGGVVSANAVGFAAQVGPGNGTTSGAGFGAGHGGFGGASGGGAAYGSISAPVTLGSGGGYSSGGVGGGAVKLIASQTFVVDGAVTAHGGNGGYSSGGGAGGSIWLGAQTLSGNGTVRANGGNSYLNNQGGGAGGRVAIIAAQDTSTLLVGTNVQAAGGLATGGAGTVFSRVGNVDALRVDNNGLAGARTPGVSATYHTVAVRGGAQLVLPTGVAVTVQGGVTGNTSAGTQGTLRVDSGATLALPLVTELERLDFNVAGSLTGVSHFRIAQGTWTYAPQVAHEFGAITLGVNSVVEYGGTQRLAIIGKLDLQSNAILRHQPTVVPQGTAPGAQHVLDITCSEATIGLLAMIDLNGRGYNRGAGPGRGTTGTTAGGGGYGGAGGQSSAAILGGAPYGSASLPDDVGSGGGDDSNSATNTNGAGGGLLKLAVCGALTVDGIIRANGEIGETQEGGGGSGGGIRIDAGALAGVGSIQANGGTGGSNGGNGGGGGGGGRIAISYGAKTYIGAVVANGGARGGTGAATAGANGSVEQAERQDAVCENPPCGIGLCAGSWDASIGACDYGPSNGTTCSDGNACTHGDMCASGTCVGGTAVVCNDGNACTNDACDAQLGCRFTPRSGACDDGNACTQNTTCVNSVCAGGTATNCDDGNQCTAETCDPVTGCASTPLSNTTCSDGDPCTTNDLCATGTCVGVPLRAPGCFGAFPGAPVIGPVIPTLVSRDGGAVSIDLSDHENDYEDGPGGDHNLLFWSIDDTQPWLYEVDFDPATEVLTLTPRDTQPFSTVFTVTLVDSDGLTDTQLVVYEHTLSRWSLTLAAAPTELRVGQSTTLTATLSSPAGRTVGNRLVTLALTGAPRGYLASAVAVTDAAGVATFTFHATENGTQTFAATHADGRDTAAADTSVDIVPAANDAAVFTLDLAFFDPLTGFEVLPGDVDPVAPGAPLELRARVRNLGTRPTPPLTVAFTDRRVVFSPPSVSAEVVLTTLMTPPLDPGTDVVLSHTTSFAEVGFHLFGVVIDPDDDFPEDDEDNNNAAQGFWIGPTGGGMAVVAATCELRGAFTEGGVTAVHVDGALELTGRADYAPFLPFDPDGSLGIAGVRGGRVSLRLFDAQGVEVSYSAGATAMFPATGNATTHRALYTVGQWDGPDQSPVGRFPNRSADDVWAFPPPQTFGCYTLRACVDDASFEGCCEETFCVVPRGADLTCEAPTLPVIDGLERGPEVGVPTTVSAPIQNEGDVTVGPVFARLVADGVPVAVAELGAMGPYETKVASFAWTPTCGTSELAVEVDFDDLIEEHRESDNRCARTTKDLALDRIVAMPAAGCAMDFGLAQVGVGGLPAPAVSGAITVTSPSGATQEATTAPGRGTLVGGPFTFAEAGVYTVVGRLDTPFGADQCGVAPESDEVANNTVTLAVCADPSPWRDPQGENHRGAIDVALSATPLRYGTAVTVTATLTNHGLIPLSGPIDVLLTTARGPILATDADASGDRKTLVLSCADPLVPGASKEVSWQWTPRYQDDDLGPEVRELLVVVDPEQTLASCAPANDVTRRAFSMNLFAGISGPSVGLGEATFTTLVGNNGGLVPNGEGAIARFALRRASGALVQGQTVDIVSPAPNAPESSSFTVDLGAADCDPLDPLTRAELFADATEVYSEFNEVDNLASVSLPNLVPVRITQVADGCQSRFSVEVDNLAPDPHLPVGTWYAKVTLTPPGGAPSTSLAGPFTGTGTFEILSNIETTAAGPYAVDVTIDGRDTTACGDLFESNERDNTLSRIFTLCADPSAAVTGADLQVVGPVRWGTPFTVVGHVRNVGGIALTGDITARLALADRPLSTVDAAEKTLGFDCQAPLRPGDTRTFTWEVTLHESDGVSALVMMLDPDGARDECSETNNVATRALWLDLSPWLDYRGANFGAGIDITADQISSTPTHASYSIFARPPHPNSDEPPIVIGPRGDEGAFSRHTWVKRSGDRVLVGTSPIGTPIAGTPSEVLFTAAPLACDLFDPPSHLEVFVDASKRLAENDESNNTTTRPFPNLAPGVIKRTDVQQSRTSIDVPVAQLVNKALPHPAFHVAGTLTSPSGAVIPLSAGPASTSPVRLGSNVLVRENGLYHVLAEVDAPTDAAPCGLVAEQDEVDNVAVASFFLCPDVKVTSRFLAPPAFGMPTPIEVELENVGNTTLIEDVALTVKGFTHDGVEVPLTLSPATPVISAAPGNGVDPEHTRTTVFSWTPSAATATVARFEIEARIVDTVPDNGAYADAECRTDNNKTSLTTTLDRGCVAQIDFGTWTACAAESDFTVTVTRPESGAPILPTAVASVTATLTSLSGEWPVGSRPVLVGAEGAGIYQATLALPPASTWSAVRGSVTVTTVDGATCQAQADTVIQPGVPDLSVHSSDIRLVAKNGDPAAFNRAAVGDQLDLQVMVSNHQTACQARNVVGTFAIELGFGQIALGTWSIPRLDPGTSAAVTLAPNAALPNPPTVLGGGLFRWAVTAPSPWLHVFKAQITGATVLDVKRTDNGATRSLLIGDLGTQGDLSVSIVAPTTGAPLIAHTRATTTLRVSDLDGDPVAPAQLARFSLFALDGQGGGFSGDPAIDDAIDVLAFGTYLGDGLYETELDIALPVTRTLELVAMAARVDGQTGSDEGLYPIIDDDPDCPCDDGNACTIDRCDEDGACVYLPLPPRPVPDATCDGVDDDCDGLTDEDFVGATEVCGENACAHPTTTRCVDGEVVSDCDPIWAAITELGDDVCTPDVPEQVAYAIAYTNGKPVGTIRCYNRAGDPTPVRCDTEADGKTLVVYDGLYCPVR